jgi:hypothetical protein
LASFSAAFILRNGFGRIGQLPATALLKVLQIPKDQAAEPPIDLRFLEREVGAAEMKSITRLSAA